MNLDTKDEFNNAEPFSKDFPLDLDGGRQLGKMVVKAEGGIKYPKQLTLTNNHISANASLTLQHELPEVPSLPPHFQLFLQGNASDKSLLDGQIAEAELTFNGLLLKGIPQYLSQIDFLKNNKIELKQNDDSSTTLRKTFTASNAFQSDIAAIIENLVQADKAFTYINNLKEQIETIQDLLKLNEQDLLREITNTNVQELKVVLLEKLLIKDDIKKLRKLRNDIDEKQSKLIDIIENSNSNNSRNKIIEIIENTAKVSDLQKKLKNNLDLIQIMPKDKLDKLTNEEMKDFVFTKEEFARINQTLKTKDIATEINIKKIKESIKMTILENLNKQFKAIFNSPAQELELIKSFMSGEFSRKEKLLESLSKLSFRCSPEFIRVIRFPIVEKEASAGGSNVSGSAAIGVSGDVVINLTNPTCTISLVPPFKGESSTFIDVNILSHGFFGVRAEGEAEGELSKEFNVKFCEPEEDKDKDSILKNRQKDPEARKCKSNKVAIKVEPSEEERKAFKEVVIKMANEVQRSNKFINQLIDGVVNEINSRLIDPILTDIENAFIALEPSRLCSTFNDLANLPSDATEMCRLLSFPRPPLPTIDLSIVDKLENDVNNLEKELVDVGKNLSNKEKDLRDFLCVCKTFKIFGKKVKVCNPFRCDILNEELNKEVNDLKNKVENELPQKLNKAREDVKTARKIAENNLNEDMEKFNVLVNKLDRLHNPEVIKNIAQEIFKTSIKLPNIDSRKIAEKLVNLAFDIENGVKEVNEAVELVNDFINKIPLSFSIKGFARAAISSRARIIEAKPTYEISSTLDVDRENPNLKLLLSTKGLDSTGQTLLDALDPNNSTDQNNISGRIGGLDLIGVTFTADTEISFENRTIGNIKKVQTKEVFAPTIGKGFLLSNEKKIHHEKTIPLPFSRLK